MAWLIGMDEAGYGPNLGPLVVSATVWEVPGKPRDCDLWSSLADVICQSPKADDPRFHVADSKVVYNSARGLGALERSVLAALSLCGVEPRTYRELFAHLTDSSADEVHCEPWFQDSDLDLPHAPIDREVESLSAAHWRDCCGASGIRLAAIHSEIVLTERFNDRIRRDGNKSSALSRISLGLLSRLWTADDPRPALIIGDKHGGRNRYDLFLNEILDGQMVFRVEESTLRSVYRVGQSELRFEAKGETHLPVALASMVSKYVRELSMTLFNQFWCAHVDGLRPTAGYPGDAARFRDDVAAARLSLNIPDDTFWRMR